MVIHTLADFCESLGLPVTMVPDVMEAFQRRELAELAAHEARLARTAGRPDHEVLPLRDAEGEFGMVEARIPETLFFNLMARKSFGWEGLTSDEGMRDILRDNPQCRVKTVSGRIQSGWTPGRKVFKKY
jgi:hypothetical protein